MKGRGVEWVGGDTGLGCCGWRNGSGNERGVLLPTLTSLPHSLTLLLHSSTHKHKENYRQPGNMYKEKESGTRVGGKAKRKEKEKIMEAREGIGSGSETWPGGSVEFCVRGETKGERR